MKLIKRIGVAVALACGLAAVGTSSFAASYVEGTDYVRLASPQPAAKDKVEVIEFFWYGCPHCYRLQKPWEPWLAANSKSIEYKPQPAVLGKSWEIMARAYHAMVASGGFDRDLHRKLFAAIHERNMAIQTLEGDEPRQLFAFIEKEKGAAYAQKFKQDYSGFTMGARIAKDREVQKSYGIAGTPTVIIAGKYSVSPGNKGGEEAMVPVVDFLVKKAAEEMKSAKK